MMAHDVQCNKVFLVIQPDWFIYPQYQVNSTLAAARTSKLVLTKCMVFFKDHSSKCFVVRTTVTIIMICLDTKSKSTTTQYCLLTTHQRLIHHGSATSADRCATSLSSQIALSTLQTLPAPNAAMREAFEGPAMGRRWVPKQMGATGFAAGCGMPCFL